MGAYSEDLGACLGLCRRVQGLVWAYSEGPGPVLGLSGRVRAWFVPNLRIWDLFWTYSEGPASIRGFFFAFIGPIQRVQHLFEVISGPICGERGLFGAYSKDLGPILDHLGGFWGLFWVYPGGLGPVLGLLGSSGSVCRYMYSFRRACFRPDLAGTPIAVTQKHICEPLVNYFH